MIDWRLCLESGLTVVGENVRVDHVDDVLRTNEAWVADCDSDGQGVGVHVCVLAVNRWHHSSRFR